VPADEKRMLCRVIAVIGLGLLMGGCAAPRPRAAVTDSDVSAKVRGMKQGVRVNDRAILAHLVADLDSDDPAVRLYAIESLERLTEQDLGYRYYDDEVARRPAIERWRAWLAEQK
jgi:hypothetical protein